MRLNKAVFWIPSLLVLPGCPSPEGPAGGVGGSPQVDSIRVTCRPALVGARQTSQCTALALDLNGTPITGIPSYGWASDNNSVAEVDGTGKVTTLSAGTVTITASAPTSDIPRPRGRATLTIIDAEGTVHTGGITANETWLVSGNPHVVRGSLSVSGATLTLEAGVEVLFEQNGELVIDTRGALKAMGTPEAPIRMVSSQPSPTKGSWRGVAFKSPGSASELNHVTLSHCGALSKATACIAITQRAAPVLRHVTVQDTGSVGIEVADDGSAFGIGSTTLSVLRGNSYVVRTGANTANTLPTGGTFTDNVHDAIALHGHVSRTQTWPKLGIPYVLSYIRVEGADSPTLTLLAGTVLRFAPQGGLYVGIFDPGGLIVDGTEAAPVLFTSDSPSPAHWQGLHLHKQTTNSTRISHAIIEYAGNPGSIGKGNLNLYGNGRDSGSGPRPVIDHVIVQKGPGYGVYLEAGGAFGPGSTLLTARDNGSYAISVEANDAGSLPTGGTFSGNAFDAVEISTGWITTTQTWPNLGIPYVFRYSVMVGHRDNPKLTLLPGTELRFGQQEEFRVGRTAEPGTLIAVGTSAEPIRFIPNMATPTRGHWGGLHFWHAEGSRLDHVVVTHAGAWNSHGTGNLNVYREIGAFVTNSTFNDSSGCGITVSDGSDVGSDPVTTNFTLATYNNTFSGNTGANLCTN